VFEAIADPTRRAIVAVLAGEPAAVERIAAHFPVSRPAVSKHLRILHEAGVVRREARGRTNVYTLQPDALAEVKEWVEDIWRGRLTLLKRLAEGDG
jgi:DNA-binding transcriptional ArsR family regulator